MMKQTPCKCPKNLCLHPMGAVKEKSVMCRLLDRDDYGNSDDESLEAAGFNPFGATHFNDVEDALIAVLDRRAADATG